jgi:hypothetical protein
MTWLSSAPQNGHRIHCFPALKPAARAPDTLETVRHAAAVDPRVADITLVPAAGSAAILWQECVRLEIAQTKPA